MPDTTAPLPPSTIPPDIMGMVLAGRYRVGDLLERGGMSIIYFAKDLEFDRPCIVKVAAGDGFCARLEREAEVGARMKVPGLVEVRDRGAIGLGEAYYVIFEYLDGETLASRLRHGVMPWEEAVRMGVEVARTVAALHRQYIVHRDVKPENLFLLRSGGVKVLDLGIASVPGHPALTVPGQVLGTPLYMPPEQVENASRVDSRVDVYALGLVLARAIGGPKVLPTVRSTEPEVFREDVQNRPRLGGLAPDVPPEVVTVVEKACATDRDDRYATMVAFGDALEELLARKAEMEARRAAQAARRRRALLAAGALGVAGLGFAAGYGTRASQEVAPGAVGTESVCASQVPAPVVMPGQVPWAMPLGEVATLSNPVGQSLDGDKNASESTGDDSSQEGSEMNKFTKAMGVGAAVVGAVMATPKHATSGKPPEPCKVDSDCKKNQACKPAGSLGMWCADKDDKCISHYRFTKKAPEPIRTHCWISSPTPGIDPAKLY